MTRSLLDLLPGRPKDPVLPRLTRRATAQVMADRTGEDPSKMLAQLDRDRAKRQGKRSARLGRNSFGTMEHAVDFAMAKLGVERVAAILKVNPWSLRKGVDPNQGDRVLPDFSVRALLGLIAVLKDEGHTEHFTAVLHETGDAAAAVEHLPSLHHALTLSLVTHGDVARAVAEAADPEGEAISRAEAAAILDAIARHQEATALLQQQVMAAARVKETAS